MVHILPLFRGLVTGVIRIPQVLLCVVNAFFRNIQEGFSNKVCESLLTKILFLVQALKTMLETQNH